MSKSKHSGSPLYMNSREFADLVVQILHEQNYFKNDEVAHPQDIAIAFSTIAETIGTTMSWAISQDHKDRKNAIMQTGNLRKYALPQDDEIAPITEDELGYSEYRHKNAYL
jgi:hypothetical protein